MPRMDYQRLQPALLPANTLPKPVLQVVRRLSRCVGRQSADPRAKSRQAEAEIRVLRHVPRVPTADPTQGPRSKMIRAAPQRYRQVERRQSGVHEIEQDSIFDCEQRAQPVIRRVMDGQARLQGIDMLSC